MSRGRARVEKQSVEVNNPHRGHRYMCDGNMALCWSEEGEPWDGRYQTVVYQVAVSFPEAFVEGVSRICLRSGHLLC
jgi:hypothetical protein